MLPNLQRMASIFFENKSRESNIMLKYYKDELITRLRIYEKCTKFSMKEIVNTDALIEYL